MLFVFAVSGYFVLLAIYASKALSPPGNIGISSTTTNGISSGGLGEVISVCTVGTFFLAMQEQTEKTTRIVAGKIKNNFRFTLNRGLFLVFIIVFINVHQRSE
jgi:hypothetical protein